MVSGLLCWRDSHPPDQVKLIAKRLGVTEQDVVDMNRRLGGDASLNGVAGFAAGGSSSDRKRSRPIRAFSATPYDGQRPCMLAIADEVIE